MDTTNRETVRKAIELTLMEYKEHELDDAAVDTLMENIYLLSLDEISGASDGQGSEEI